MPALPWQLRSEVRYPVEHWYHTTAEAKMGFTVNGVYFEQERSWTVDNDGVHVLPILPDGRLVLVDIIRPNFKTVHSLEVPGGGHEVKKGLTHEESVRKELLDETGYRAGKIEPIFGVASYPSSCTASMCIYFASELERVSEPKFEPREFINQVVAMTLDEAFSLIPTQVFESEAERHPFALKIIQPATIIALQELKRRRLEETVARYHRFQ